MRFRPHTQLIGIVLLAMTLPSYGQAVTANVLRRAILIKAGSALGTAFTIEVDGRQYLVTAKHVVASLPDEAESTIQVLRKRGWFPLSVKVLRCAEPVDIAVLVPPRQISINFPLEPTSKGLAVGQDAYFVGFPYGLQFAKTYDSFLDVFGFVKRATVAQLGPNILLDGYNNPGFSGSPVVFRDWNKPGLEFKVAGVIASYESYTAPVFDKTEIRENQVTAEDRAQNHVLHKSDGRVYRLRDTGKLVQLNTGIATAWDIGYAVDLIRRHPSGPTAVDTFTPGLDEIQPQAPDR